MFRANNANTEAGPLLVDGTPAALPTVDHEPEQLSQMDIAERKAEPETKEENCCCTVLRKCCEAIAEADRKAYSSDPYDFIGVP